MPYIPLEEHLPGITGLLEYRQDSAKPIRELTQVLLRGPSTLTEGERELIATVVSSRNECRFCTAAHTAVQNRHSFRDDTTVAMSSRSPSVKVDGPRSKTCVSSRIGLALSWRYSSSPVMPGRCSSSGM